MKAAASAQEEQKVRLLTAASAVAQACLPEVRGACLEATVIGIDQEPKSEN